MSSSRSMRMLHSPEQMMREAIAVSYIAYTSQAAAAAQGSRRRRRYAVSPNARPGRTASHGESTKTRSAVTNSPWAAVDRWAYGGQARVHRYRAVVRYRLLAFT